MQSLTRGNEAKHLVRLSNKLDKPESSFCDLVINASMPAVCDEETEGYARQISCGPTALVYLACSGSSNQVKPRDTKHTKTRKIQAGGKIKTNPFNNAESLEISLRQFYLKEKLSSFKPHIGEVQMQPMTYNEGNIRSWSIMPSE